MKVSIPLIFISLVTLVSCTTHSLKRTGADSIVLALNKPFAENVQFLSSLDGFQAHGVRRDNFGSWEIILPAERNFTYFYRIDGVVYVPDCTFKEFDDFGAQNCVYLP